MNYSEESLAKLVRVDPTFQKFIRSLESGQDGAINVVTADAQTQVLNWLIQLMGYCAAPDTIPKELHLHPAFFAIPRVEQFFTTLFGNLDESVCLKAEEIFLCGLSFILRCVHCPISLEVMRRLLRTLQTRFPMLKAKHETANANFIDECFRPTMGEFLDHRGNAIIHVQKEFPLLYELFVAPLSSVRDRKLFNFYSNPWIYYPIMDYLAHYAQSASLAKDQIFRRTRLESLEKHLQIIHGRITAESWTELTKKARKLFTHSSDLEPFAIECGGLWGEIKTAAQWDAKDSVRFLPERNGQGRNCDLLIIRPTGNKELVECKAKMPRHGLDEKTAGEAQIWDDFLTNFIGVIYSYLNYLQKTIQPSNYLRNLQQTIQRPMGLAEYFPLLAVYERSDYAQALPLIREIPITIGDIPLKKWTAEHKVRHLLRALFLHPLALGTCCGPLPSDEDRLAQRQRATETAIKNKDWIISILNKATKQLEETHNRLTTEGQVITKLHVALDLDLSYRLLRDSWSHDDGNIAEIAEKALHETFEPYKIVFAKKNLDLHLFIIRA
jgi:hypothetical protein